MAKLAGYTEVNRSNNVTDNSGGTSNAATGVVANAFKQTFIIPVRMAALANGQTLKLAVPFAFNLLAIRLRSIDPVTTGSKLATITAQVNGVAVTGGVVSATSAGQTPAGAVQSGTAITAGGTGTAGQTIEAAISAVTTFVEGAGQIEMDVTNVDMANAIATLIAN